MLRSNATAGAYDQLTDDKSFAERVTEDLQAVSADAHLRLFAPRTSPASAAGGARPARPPEAVEKLARLTPTVAYIRLGFMSQDPAITAQVRDFLRANADAETIIFDLRTNIGGTPAMMEAALPFFFDAPVEVSNVEMRAVPGTTPMTPGARQVEAPLGMVRTVRTVTPSAEESRLRDARVYVLISTRTASAAEGFAFAFQQTKRAKIVGEASYGAGHFGSVVPLVSGFSAFVPFGRPYNPITNKGWEGEGVIPDIAALAQTALVAALLDAGMVEAEARPLADTVDPEPARMKPQRPPKRL